MTDTSDFYAVLSWLFRQIAKNPGTRPTIPVNDWPVGSYENALLESFQEMLTALDGQGRSLQHPEHLHQNTLDALGGEMSFYDGVSAREQAALLEISQTLASALELHPGLILDQLRTIIEYTHATLFVLEDDALITLASRGPQVPEPNMDFRVPLEDPEALAVLFNQRQPIRIGDIWHADPAMQLLQFFVNHQAARQLEGVRAWMWVPLAVKGRVIGGIGIGHTQADYFTAHHADLALIVANQAAITMVNADLHEKAQALAVLEERQHLARNLHDAVNQSLFSASLIAEVLPRLWERDQDQARRSLKDLRRLTRGAMAEMRAMLVELRSSALADPELGDLLKLLGHALAAKTNLPVTVTVLGQGTLRGQGKLPAEVQIALYRICQEGLNNIAKHAGASEVSVELYFEGEAVELRLKDNGLGFDPQNIAPGHFGLEMIRERAAAVGAFFTIKSELGQGSEIITLWTKDLLRKSS